MALSDVLSQGYSDSSMSQWSSVPDWVFRPHWLLLITRVLLVVVSKILTDKIGTEVT